MARFRYSRAKFWQAVSVALALTALVMFLSWLLLNFAGLRNADVYSAATALIFLGFCSAGMLWRYSRNEVILAVLPTGIADVRWASGDEPVGWERVRQITLRQRESDFELVILLWPGENGGRGDSQLTSDLTPLEGDVETVVRAINRYVPVVVQTAGGFAEERHV